MVLVLSLPAAAVAAAALFDRSTARNLYPQTRDHIVVWCSFATGMVCAFAIVLCAHPFFLGLLSGLLASSYGLAALRAQRLSALRLLLRLSYLCYLHRAAIVRRRLQPRDPEWIPLQTSSTSLPSHGGWLVLDRPEPPARFCASRRAP